MARCLSTDVTPWIRDYDTAVDLAPFIQLATILTDKVEDNDSGGILDSDLLKEIEIQLTAHFYEQRDHSVSSESTGGASASYTGQFGLGLDRTRWGQTAKMLDLTGFLSSIAKGKTKLTFDWLGKAPSEQTDYVDRD